ncbi:MAG: hypothetical protein ACO1QS_11355 [Verrucomicrobiota bacterium]
MAKKYKCNKSVRLVVFQEKLTTDRQHRWLTRIHTDAEQTRLVERGF